MYIPANLQKISLIFYKAGSISIFKKMTGIVILAVKVHSVWMKDP